MNIKIFKFDDRTRKEEIEKKLNKWLPGKRVKEILVNTAVAYGFGNGSWIIYTIILYD